MQKGSEFVVEAITFAMESNRNNAPPGIDFTKLSFRPKNYWINFLPQILLKFTFKTTYVNITDNNLKLQDILKP
jgi:hypothetical protein